MTTATKPTNAKTNDLSRFCSVCAQQANLDAGGTTYSYAHVLAVEIPLPWPESMYSEPGILPQELLDLREKLMEAYHRGESLHIGSVAIAPDPAYSRPGYRRVISYRRPDAPFANFEQTEYLAPESEYGALCWALLIDHDALPRFAAYQQPASSARDLLVCTHGAVDAACAKFGFPTYQHLRRLADQTPEQLRVWRVSHFGGHVFAPTLLEMPAFRSWGYIEREAAEQLACQTGDLARLHTCYRGWAGLESQPLQIAERALFMRHGWPWATYLKAGRVLAQDDTAAPDDHDAMPAWADVQIDYAAPDGSAQGSYHIRVELAGRVDCRYSTAEAETYAYPQYVVTRMEQLR